MRKWIMGVLSSALVIVATAQAAAQQAQAPQGYWPWSGDGYGWPFWWICPAMMGVMIGVVAAILLTRRHGGAGMGHRHDSAAALQVLNERFARGEILRQEYEEKKAAILTDGEWRSGR